MIIFVKRSGIATKNIKKTLARVTNSSLSLEDQLKLTLKVWIAFHSLSIQCSASAFLKLLVDKGAWYDRKDLQWKQVKDLRSGRPFEM